MAYLDIVLAVDGHNVESVYATVPERVFCACSNRLIGFYQFFKKMLLVILALICEL